MFPSVLIYSAAQTSFRRLIDIPNHGLLLSQGFDIIQTSNLMAYFFTPFCDVRPSRLCHVIKIT